MKLSIHHVADKGNLQKERLIIKVNSDTDAGDYILIQSGFFDESISINTHHTYWFPNKQVKAGDVIVVYTKDGKDNAKKRKNGKMAHFFYWGLTDPIWEENDRAAVLLHAPEWISKKPDEL